MNMTSPPKAPKEDPKQPRSDFADALGSDGIHTEIRDLNDPFFKKIHIGISREGFRQQMDKDRSELKKKIAEAHNLNPDDMPSTGFMPLVSNDNLVMQVSEDTAPTYETFMKHMEKVGGSFGWHLREKYQDREAVEKMLRDKHTRLLEFRVNGKNVGFTLITGIQRDYPEENQSPAKRGIRKQAAIKKLIRAENARLEEMGSDVSYRERADAIEIYKFGMYETHAGQRYGHFFLPHVLELLLEEDGYDFVYLDTRDTNPPGTRRFYRSHGLYEFEDEMLPSDIVNDNGPNTPNPNNQGGGGSTGHADDGDNRKASIHPAWYDDDLSTGPTI